MNTYLKNELAALGDPTRLAIFDMLADHPRAVNELAAELPVSRPAVSQHLKVLKGARLVRDRRAGTRRIYELNTEGVAMLRDHFARLWDRSLANFKRAVEEEFQKEKVDGSRSSSDGSGKAHDPRKRAH